MSDSEEVEPPDQWINSQFSADMFKYQKTHIDSELLDVVVMKNEGLW